MNGGVIKVLSVSTSDTGGGAARAAYRIHNSLLELGVDSRMLVKDKSSDDERVLELESFKPHDGFHKSLEWAGNKCKNQIQHYRWNRYPEREQYYMSDLRGGTLYGTLQQLDYDILHLHWINQRFVKLDQLPKDVPIVWTLHDSWPFCGICHYFLDCDRYEDECGCCPHLHSKRLHDLSHAVWKRKAQIYKHLNLYIVTPSQWLGDCAKRSSLLGRFPVTVIPNCLDVNIYRPHEDKDASSCWQELMANKMGKRFLLYGAVNAAKDTIKGFAYLVSALRQLERMGHGNDVELIVFGATESGLDTDLSIPIHYVGYVGRTEELVSLYNMADVMVVPSLTEVFGQTASEALACGLPVVAFRCTGIQEIVDHKLNGYLAEPRDSKDFAAGIVWCLNNNADNVLGKAGRKKAERRYACDVVGMQYKQLYESLIKTK